jgi:hypothetical protein
MTRNTWTDCPYYRQENCKCTLTGKGCLCEEGQQAHCVRRLWALEYQAKHNGQPPPLNGPNIES